ncbi:hypothetical protein ACLOJK_037928 [Asimina triloba]
MHHQSTDSVLHHPHYELIFLPLGGDDSEVNGCRSSTVRADGGAASNGRPGDGRRCVVVFLTIGGEGFKIHHHDAGRRRCPPSSSPTTAGQNDGGAGQIWAHLDGGERLTAVGNSQQAFDGSEWRGQASGGRSGGVRDDGSGDKHDRSGFDHQLLPMAKIKNPAPNSQDPSHDPASSVQLTTFNAALNPTATTGINYAYKMELFSHSKGHQGAPIKRKHFGREERGFGHGRLGG